MIAISILGKLPKKYTVALKTSYCPNLFLAYLNFSMTAAISTDIYNSLSLPQKKALFRVILKKYPNLFKSVIGKYEKKIR